MSATTQSFAYFFQQCVYYITIVLLVIAHIAVIYAIICRGNIKGFNIFNVNRIAGIVWIGRPLLFVRGITALGLQLHNLFNLITEQNTYCFKMLNFGLVYNFVWTFTSPQQYTANSYRQCNYINMDSFCVLVGMLVLEVKKE
ncbi:hypothetical protein THRCLA_22313, partial [Thraustotheca clavata]